MALLGGGKLARLTGRNRLEEGGRQCGRLATSAAARRLIAASGRGDGADVA